jgi:hypothetical protein
VRYSRMKELWIPASNVRAEFKVIAGQLEQAVLEGKVRTLQEWNSHNEKFFTIYALADLEKLFQRKRQARIFTKKEGTIWGN